MRVELLTIDKYILSLVSFDRFRPAADFRRGGSADRFRLIRDVQEIAQATAVRPFLPIRFWNSSPAQASARLFSG